MITTHNLDDQPLTTSINRLHHLLKLLAWVPRPKGTPQRFNSSFFSFSASSPSVPLGTRLILVLLLTACGAAAPTVNTNPRPVQTNAIACPAAPGPFNDPLAFISENKIMTAAPDGTTNPLSGPLLDVLTQDPVWSPDGTTLAFSLIRITPDPANPDGVIVALQLICGIDRRTGQGRELARRTNATTYLDEIAWSPDNQRLLVTAVPLAADALPQIEQIDLASGNTTPRIKAGRNPSFGPTTDAITFVQVDRTSMRLVSTASDASAAQPLLSNDPGFAYFAAPAWSPDGTQLVFTAASPPPATPTAQRILDWLLDTQTAHAHSIDADLWLLDRATNELRRLTNGLDDPRATWSPDGKTIAYTGDKEGGVWQIDLATGTAKRLTEQGNASTISWRRSN